MVLFWNQKSNKPANEARLSSIIAHTLFSLANRVPPTPCPPSLGPNLSLLHDQGKESLWVYNTFLSSVAFRIYDIDQDGFISNGELFQVLKTMVGSNLTDKQLQEIVDKTILYADKDGDGKISFDEFCKVSTTCM